MDLLKRTNWWVWLLIWFFASDLIKNVILGVLLKSFDADQWYAKWWIWVIGILLLFLPFMIMLIVFSIQIKVTNAEKLEVPGSEIYTSPYFWILGFIIPILGWIALALMGIYLTIMIFVQLASGAAEKFATEELA